MVNFIEIVEYSMAFARESSGKLPLGIIPMVQFLLRNEDKNYPTNEIKVKEVFESAKLSDQNFSRDQGFDRWKFSILFENRKKKKNKKNFELIIFENEDLGVFRDIYI